MPNKKTFLFILITCIAFALSHDAYAARDGILDLKEALASGATITISGAGNNDSARQVKRAKKSSNNTDDFAVDFDDDNDDFVSGDDFSDDSDDEETQKEETPVEEPKKEEPKKAAPAKRKPAQKAKQKSGKDIFRDDCLEEAPIRGALDQDGTTCTLTDETITDIDALNKAIEIYNKKFGKAEGNCKSLTYEGTKMWSTACTAKDGFVGTWLIYMPKITCEETQIFNDDTGKCDTKAAEEPAKAEEKKEETPAEEPADEKEEAKSEESASETSANGTEEVAASKDEEEKSGSSINDDLFKLDDGDSQTVSVFDFETKAMDSDFEAITLIENSQFGDKIDSCNDVNANSDRPYIKCDIKSSTKKYKFYFKSIGGAAKEPTPANISDKKDPKEQKLHEDAEKIISAYKETKTKINNKKS